MPSAILSASDEPDFKLGEWWVRPHRNELERGDKVVRIEARSMGVLVCLAQRAPRVSSKQYLLDNVWCDSPFVGEEVISHTIWELRKALGDSARDPTFIQTVPRKGYRLLQEVTRPSGSPVPVAGARIGHYEICRELDRGSMGVVYEAYDRQLDRIVALKFLAPELTRDDKACRRFEREARLAASLDHPNLATVHEIGETSQGHRYLVTPFYSRGSLKDRLSRGNLSIDEAVDWACQLGSGLAVAHARAIVHRDIKPANLLLDEHGTLKIGDFGIAKLLGGTDLTSTGATLGTPAYKSPEQCRGESVDHRTDVWSMGIVLFEMLTGRRPFDGEFEHAVVHAILSNDPRVSDDGSGRPIPPVLCQIISKAMAKDPNERFQDASEMVAALRALRPEQRLGAAPASVRSQNLRKGLAAALLVAVSTLAALAINYHRSSRVSVGEKGGVEIGSKGGAHIDQTARDHLTQGKRLWMRGNSQSNLLKAEEHFRQAIELEPTWVDALAHLAVLHADVFALFNDANDRVSATKLVERAEIIEPDFPLSQVARARLALIDGDLDVATKLGQIAVAQEPACGRGESCDLAYLWLAEALWRQHRDGEAEEILERGFKEGDGYIRCRLKRAQFFEERGRSDEAILDYKAVLKWDPEQTTALNELGAIYLKRSDYVEAAGLFRELVRKTSDPNAVLNLGHALYGQRLWENALEQYEYAELLYQSEDKLIPTPAVSIGDVYLETGRPSEAIPKFEQAFAMFEEMAKNPSLDVNRLGQRAVCLAKLNRFPEAEEAMSALMKKAGPTPHLLVYAARIHALNRDDERLYETAKQAVEAGIPPNRLLDDAAFILYRPESEYRLLLEPELER